MSEEFGSTGMATVWRQFGDPIGLPFSEFGESRWFNAEPSIKEHRVESFEQHWQCPVENCGGEMIVTALSWLVQPEGHHHSCNKCGFTAAICAQFPRIITRAVPDQSSQK